MQWSIAAEPGLQHLSAAGVAVQPRQAYPKLGLLLLANTASRPLQHLAVGPSSLQEKKADLTGWEAHAVSGWRGRSASLMAGATTAAVQQQDLLQSSLALNWGT
jgi:hypothetical protein